MAIARQVSQNKINIVGMSSNRKVHFVFLGVAEGLVITRGAVNCVEWMHTVVCIRTIGGIILRFSV
jgi:hypothetical protein